MFDIKPAVNPEGFNVDKFLNLRGKPIEKESPEISGASMVSKVEIKSDIKIKSVKKIKYQSRRVKEDKLKPKPKLVKKY